MVFVEKYTLKATKKSRWKELRKIVPEVFYVFLVFQRVSQQFSQIQKNFRGVLTERSKPQIWDNISKIMYKKEKEHYKYSYKKFEKEKGAKNFPSGIGYRDTIIISMELPRKHTYLHPTR